MKRIYETILNDHLKRHRQMALMTGPRQVGKTTTSLASAKPAHYFNWDRQSDRIALTRGADAVADTAGIHQIASGKASSTSMAANAELS